MYIRKMHMFFSTIGEVWSRQYAWDAALFLEFCEKDVLFVIDAKICNGKIKGLAILL